MVRNDRCGSMISDCNEGNSCVVLGLARGPYIGRGYFDRQGNHKTIYDVTSSLV